MWLALPSMRTLFLGIAAIPFIYYGLAIFSCLRFFRTTSRRGDAEESFLPPLGNL
jgi:ceramide glucosyltransferase